MFKHFVIQDERECLFKFSSSKWKSSFYVKKLEGNEFKSELSIQNWIH